jgi:hypothetical protein
MVMVFMEISLAESGDAREIAVSLYQRLAVAVSSRGDWESIAGRPVTILLLRSYLDGGAAGFPASAIAERRSIATHW